MRNILMGCALPLMALAALTACNDNKDKKADGGAEPPAVAMDVARAIAEGHPERVASLTTYPLERPYPLRNIADSAAFVE